MCLRLQLGLTPTLWWLLSQMYIELPPPFLLTPACFLRLSPWQHLCAETFLTRHPHLSMLTPACFTLPPAGHGCGADTGWGAAQYV